MVQQNGWRGMYVLGYKDTWDSEKFEPIAVFDEKEQALKCAYEVLHDELTESPIQNDGRRAKDLPWKEFIKDWIIVHDREKYITVEVRNQLTENIYVGIKLVDANPEGAPCLTGQITSF